MSGREQVAKALFFGAVLGLWLAVVASCAVDIVKYAPGTGDVPAAPTTPVGGGR